MAYEFEPYKPKTFDELYQSQKALFMPDMRQQQAQMYKYLQGQRQRMGAAQPQLFASQAVESFAPAIGKAGAQAATRAREMEQADIQFGQQLDVKREAMKLQEEQQLRMLEEQRLARQQQAMMNLFQYTGFTPELLEASGLESLMGGNVGDWRRFQREIDRMNLPGQPFGASGPQQLTAQQRLQLSMFYPGASRSYKAQAAQNWGWTPQGQPYY